MFLDDFFSQMWTAQIYGLLSSLFSHLLEGPLRLIWGVSGAKRNSNKSLLARNRVNGLVRRDSVNENHHRFYPCHLSDECIWRFSLVFLLYFFKWFSYLDNNLKIIQQNHPSDPSVSFAESVSSDCLGFHNRNLAFSKAGRPVLSLVGDSIELWCCDPSSYHFYVLILLVPFGVTQNKI